MSSIRMIIEISRIRKRKQLNIKGLLKLCSEKEHWEDDKTLVVKRKGKFNSYFVTVLSVKKKYF